MKMKITSKLYGQNKCRKQEKIKEVSFFIFGSKEIK
jgi:hypothetical protein